jgi:hypothetical protein
MALATTYDLIRGDAFDSGTFSFVHPAGAAAWNNVVVRAMLRETPDGPLVHDFAPSTTVTTDGDGNGVLAFSLTMTPTVTAELSCPIYQGDVEITADLFPRLTAITLTINAAKDYART